MPKPGWGKVSNFLFCFLIAGAITETEAKVRLIQIPKPKQEISLIEEIPAKVYLTLLQKLVIPQSMNSIQFQGGQVTENIEYFQSPRCYLHFRSETPAVRELLSGQTLPVTQIDNYYLYGSLHFTLWFDTQSEASYLKCISNHDHSLTRNELRNTIGEFLDITIPEVVEKTAFINTYPSRNVNLPIGEWPLNSTRVILSNI